MPPLVFCLPIWAFDHLARALLMSLSSLESTCSTTTQADGEWSQSKAGERGGMAWNGGALLEYGAARLAEEARERLLCRFYDVNAESPEGKNLDLRHTRSPRPSARLNTKSTLLFVRETSGPTN